MEGFDESVEDSKKEKSEKSMNKSEQVTQMNNNTETEEATSMEADTEAIGIEAQLGLLNHAVEFHAKGAVTSKSMEEGTNKVVNSKSMFKEEEENDGKETNMENSEEEGGTVDVDKELAVVL